MVQYHKSIWPIQSHTLGSLIEAARGPKGRKIFWDGALVETFKERKHMVSSETLLSYTDWTIPLTFHTGDYDKQFVDVISYNNKPIALL